MFNIQSRVSCVTVPIVDILRFGNKINSTVCLSYHHVCRAYNGTQHTAFSYWSQCNIWNLSSVHVLYSQYIFLLITMQYLELWVVFMYYHILNTFSYWSQCNIWNFEKCSCTTIFSIHFPIDRNAIFGTWVVFMYYHILNTGIFVLIAMQYLELE